MSETSSKLSEVVAQANQLKAAIREEEDIVTKVLTTLPGERALIDIPAAMQWKYEYSKPNAKVRETRYGVATARHVLLTVNGLIGRTTLTVMAGPSRDFMSKNLGRLHVLLERVGGLDSLLRLIGNEIERQLQMMDKSQGGKVLRRLKYCFSAWRLTNSLWIESGVAMTSRGCEDGRVTI